jgi:hypothetical protein
MGETLVVTGGKGYKKGILGVTSSAYLWDVGTIHVCSVVTYTRQAQSSSVT